MILRGPAANAASSRPSSSSQGISIRCSNCSFFFTAALLRRSGNIGSSSTMSGAPSSSLSDCTPSAQDAFMRMAALKSSGVWRACSNALKSRTAMTGFLSQRMTSWPAAAKRNESSPSPAVASKMLSGAAIPLMRAAFTNSSRLRAFCLMRERMRMKSPRTSRAPSVR